MAAMPFKCVCESGDGSMCGEQLSTLSKLSEHISLMHLSYTPYMCKLCFCQTPSQPQLELHAKMMHPDQPTTRWLSFCGDEVKQQQLEQLLAAAGTGKQPQPVVVPATGHVSSPGASAGKVAQKKPSASTSTVKAKRGVQKELEALLNDSAHLSKPDLEAKRRCSTGPQSFGSAAKSASVSADALQKTPTQPKEKSVSKKESTPSDTIKKEADSTEQDRKRLHQKIHKLKYEASKRQDKSHFSSYVRNRAKLLWSDYCKLHPSASMSEFADKVGIHGKTLGSWLKANDGDGENSGPGKVEGVSNAKKRAPGRDEVVSNAKKSVPGTNEMISTIKRLISHTKADAADRIKYPRQLQNLVLQYLKKQKELNPHLNREVLCQPLGISQFTVKGWISKRRRVGNGKAKREAAVDSPCASPISAKLAASAVTSVQVTNLPQQSSNAHKTSKKPSSAAGKIKAKYLKTTKPASGACYSVHCHSCNKRFSTPFKNKCSEAERHSGRMQHVNKFHGSSDADVYLKCFPNHAPPTKATPEPVSQQQSTSSQAAGAGDSDAHALPDALAAPDRCKYCSGTQYLLKRRRFQAVAADSDHLLYQCANRQCGKAPQTNLACSVIVVKQHAKKHGIPATGIRSQFMPWMTHAQYESKSNQSTSLKSKALAMFNEMASSQLRANAMTQVSEQLDIPLEDVRRWVAENSSKPGTLQCAKSSKKKPKLASGKPSKLEQQPSAQCNKCGNSSGPVSALEVEQFKKQHVLKSHMQMQPYQCNVCQLATSDVLTMRLHFVEEHPSFPEYEMHMKESNQQYCSELNRLLDECFGQSAAAEEADAEPGNGGTPTSSCDNEAEAMEDVQPRVVLPVDEVMLAADTPDNEEEPAHTPSQADSGSPRSSSTPSLLERIDSATRPPVAAVKSEQNIFDKSNFD